MSERVQAPPTLDMLRTRRVEILSLAEHYHASNVRVFGSVAREKATPDSDVDILATFPEDTSIFELVGLWQDLQALLGCEVDLIADHPDGGRIVIEALKDAIAL